MTPGYGFMLTLFPLALSRPRSCSDQFQFQFFILETKNSNRQKVWGSTVTGQTEAKLTNMQGEVV